MKNELDYRFKIKRIEKSSDADYARALRIYNETTPHEIKTNTNEITKWLDRKDPADPFEPMFFSLYFAGALAGFAMMTYIRTQRIVVLEYVALTAQYRVNTVFFSYINLLESYLSENQYDVTFILNEISNRRNGKDIDKESQLFAKVLCIEGYGKINAPYITPPLGTNNHESNFEAFLFAKSAGDIHALEKQTYLDIVKAIYFDYFSTWYAEVFPPSELAEYNELLQSSFLNLSKQLNQATTIPVTYSECPILQNSGQTLKTNGLPPAIKKNTNYLLYVILVITLIACPIAVVWVYNYVLSLLGVSIGTVSGLVGNCVGSIITACVTLYIAKKRL